MSSLKKLPSDVVLFAAARSLSTLGNSMAPIAITFGMLGNGMSTVAVGSVLAADMLPMLLITVFGGLLADRFRRTSVIIYGSLLACISQAILAALILSGTTHLAALVVIAAITGASFALTSPAFQALLPDIAPDDMLVEANSVVRVLQNVARVVGPIVGGAVTAFVGAAPVLFFDAATFIAAAVLIGFIKVSGRSTRQVGVLQELRDGWSQFWAHPWLWVITLQHALLGLLWAGAFNVLAPVMLSERPSGAATWGFVTGGLAAGLIIGGLVAVAWRPHKPLVVASLGVALQSVVLLVIAAIPQVPLMVVSAVITGIGIEIFAIYFNTILQQNIHPEHLGRVSSYNMTLGMALLPVGYLAAGPAAQLFGAPRVVFWAGAITLVSSLAVVFVPSVRITSWRTTQPVGD